MKNKLRHRKRRPELRPNRFTIGVRSAQLGIMVSVVRWVQGWPTSALVMQMAREADRKVGQALDERAGA